MALVAGSIVEGRVSRVAEFGAFVEVPGGETGLVHISQIAHEYVNNVHDFVKEGDTVQVRVLGYNDRGQLDLSIKDLLAPPTYQPKPKPLPRQSPEFEHKLRSFMRDVPPADSSETIRKLNWIFMRYRKDKFEDGLARLKDAIDYLEEHIEG